MTIKDWRYYETKMNESFESGDKAQALAYQEKFVSLYRKQQEFMRPIRFWNRLYPVPLVYDIRLDKPIEIKVKPTLSIEEKEKIQHGTVVFDHNEYLDRFKGMIPMIRRVFRQEEIWDDEIEKSDWELINFVFSRYLDEGKWGNVQVLLSTSDFRKTQQKLERKLRAKIREDKRQQLTDLPLETIKRIDRFCDAVAKRKPTQAKALLTVLEIIRRDRPGYNLLSDIKATIKEIKGYDEYHPAGYASYESEKGWISKYLKEWA